MRSISNIYKLAIIVLLALSVQSCSKSNGIDNNQIITKPYSLYIVDSNGYMEHTNDGNTYSRTFPTTGTAGMALITSGTNLIWVKRVGAFVSDESYQFNPIKMAANLDPSLNQSMILNVRGYNRVYLTGASPFGVIYSDSNGKAGTWQNDNAFPTGTTNLSMTSFALMQGDKVAGYDYINKRLFIKNDRNAFWSEVIMNDLPAGGRFFISSYQNLLVLADSTGTNGVWFSANGGINWAQFTGIPADAKILAMKNAFNQAFLISSAQYGVFRLKGQGMLEQSNLGFETNMVVRNFAAKDDIYKTEEIKWYVYAVGTKGLYRSVDLGRNWILVKEGNYVLAH